MVIGEDEEKWSKARVRKERFKVSRFVGSAASSRLGESLSHAAEVENVERGEDAECNSVDFKSEIDSTLMMISLCLSDIL